VISYFYYKIKMKPKKDIVLVHGWGATSAYWQTVALKLGGKYSVHTPTVPGFDKQTLDRPYHLHDYALWLKKYLRTLDSNPILVGHSFGGAIIVKYLLENPNPQSSLVLVDAALIRDDLTIYKQVRIFLVKIAKPLVTFFKIKRLLLKLFKAEKSDYYQITDPMLKKTFQSIIYENLAEQLSKIPNRTLIVWGKNDTSTPLNQGLKIKDLIDNSTIKIINKAGHFPFIDSEDEFVKILINFVK
jgi:pimeloyl-ACP methyl ester carboxylesterase